MTEAPRPAPAEGTGALPPQSPWQLFWRQFRRSHLGPFGGTLLAALYLLALLAPFLAPYAQEEMDRARFFHPPQQLHWIEPSGRVHLLPFVHPTRLSDSANLLYREDRSTIQPLRFFVHGARYRLLDLVPTDRHLVHDRAPAGRRLGVLRRLGGHRHHAHHRAAAQHSRALPDHRPAHHLP